jgi:hypothetical protein
VNGGKNAAQSRAVSDEAIAGTPRSAHRTKRHFLLGNPELAPSKEARAGAERALSGKSDRCADALANTI